MFLLVKFLKPLKYNKMDLCIQPPDQNSRFSRSNLKDDLHHVLSLIIFFRPLDKPLVFLKHGRCQCFPSKVPQIPLQIGKCKSWMSHLDGYGQAFYNLIKRFQLVRSVFYVWCRSLHTSFVFVSINLTCDHLLSLMPKQCRITNRWFGIFLTNPANSSTLSVLQHATHQGVKRFIASRSWDKCLLVILDLFMELLANFFYNDGDVGDDDDGDDSAVG